MDVSGLRRALIGFSAAVAIVVGGAAHAAPVVSVAVDTVVPDPNTPDHYGVSQESTGPAPDGSYLLSGIGYGANFQCNWDVAVNPDPQITSTFTLKNLSGSTQTFIMTVTLPIATISPNTVQGGYFGDPVTGTQFTDTSGDSDVTLATVGLTPFYQAIVNAGPFQTVSMGLGSFTENANGGPGAFGNHFEAPWGTPIPNAPFGAATGNIQIKWTFSLTAGDTVTSKGFFRVEAPEPGSVLLVGMGLAALAGLAIARRRSA
jgi:hypothetical protein